MIPLYSSPHTGILGTGTILIIPLALLLIMITSFLADELYFSKTTF